MNSRIALVLIAVVIAAGCVNLGGREVKVSANQGLTINEFSATPTQARNSELVLFTLEVENIGGTDARDAQVDLFGVEEQWRDSLGNLLDSTQTQDLGTMDAPVPDREIPGEFRLVQWDLMTPNVPQGISPVLDVEARVSYDYNTSGFLAVKAVSEDEFRRKQILGEEIANPASIINSPGPIHLSIPDRFRTPVIVDTTDDEEFQTHPFRIEFTNVGDGFPITPEDDARIRGAGGRLRGTIEVFGPGVEFDNCLGVTSGKIVNLDNSDITVRLRETGNVPVACNIRIDKDVWADRPEDTIQFVFNIFYRYFVRDRATVQVIGG